MGLLAAVKLETKLGREKNNRKTNKIPWAENNLGLVVSKRIREGLFSSNMTAWSWRSSVMEMTKNRMTSAQPIATIFCLVLADGSEDLARDSVIHRRTMPAMATATQTRLRISSISFRL